MAIGDDRAIIFSMSDGLIPCGGLSEVVPKEGQRLCSQIGARGDAKALHLGRGHRTNAVELCYGQSLDKGRIHLRRDRELAVRLAMVGCKFCEKLIVGNARRRGEAS